MSISIIVPQLGESIVEARVARWLKKEGDWVDVGEPVVELETDKIDLEVGAERGGVLASIARQSGEDVRVGESLGVIDERATGDRRAPPDAQPLPADPAQASPAEMPPRAEQIISQVEFDERTAEPPSEPPPRATPTAKAMARAHTVDVSEVSGSGVGGRITKHDVASHVEPESASPPNTTPATITSAAPAPSTRLRPTPIRTPPPEAPSGRHEERIRMSKRRLTIAKNLVEAQRTAAMLTTFNEVDMSAIMALRTRRKESFKDQYGVNLGITSFFVKAAVATLKKFPRLNAEIQGDEMVLKHYYDIGIAVGASQGLVVPVIRDAGERSFAEIEAMIRDFAGRAEAGTLALEELRSGTFTITNGGVFGSLLSTPILNPPQVGILGLHKIEERPVAISGQISIRPMMYVALTYDHRIVDGLEAVQCLVRLKELVEDPGHLLLES